MLMLCAYVGQLYKCIINRAYDVCCVNIVVHLNCAYVECLCRVNVVCLNYAYLVFLYSVLGFMCAQACVCVFALVCVQPSILVHV